MSVSFLDSNVLVYLLDENNPAKSRVARELVEAGINETSASISYQVVQETLSVITTKLKPVVSHSEALRFMSSVLVPLWRIMPSQALYERAMAVQARYRYGFYDSLVIASALSDGCTRLYSEDFQDGQNIEGLIILNPFMRSN